MGVLVVSEHNVIPCRGVHRVNDDDCPWCGYKRINKMKSLLRKHWNKMGYSVGIDNEGYECPLSYVVHDKTQEFETFLHYSDPTARQERTVFGTPKKKLFYNYSDRLYGKEWEEGWKLALKSGAKPKTAQFYELVLKHFHDSDDLDLQHVILGCNMSNGYSYLIFGYTYTSKSGR